MPKKYDKTLVVLTHKRVWESENAYFTNGGFPLQMKALSKYFKLTIICSQKVPFRENGRELKEIIVKNFRYPFKRFKRNVNAWINLPFIIIRQIKWVRKADVLHVILPGEGGFAGLLLAILFKKRTIVRYCTDFYGDIDMPFDNLSKSLLIKVSNSPNFSTFVSSKVDEKIKSAGIRHIFSTTIEDCDIKENYKPYAESRKIIFVGRLSKEKRIETILFSLKYLKDNGYDFQLDLIGDGPEKDNLTRTVNELELENIVNFFGSIADKKFVLQNIERSLCTILVSSFEGFPKVVLESFVVGTPVILSNFKMSQYLVGSEMQRGIILKHNDPVELANSIISIKESPDYIEMHKNCKRYASERTLSAWAKHMTFEI